MSEIAHQTFAYFRASPLASLVIAFIAGFCASKTVVLGSRANILIYFVVGIVGSFLAQSVIFYFGAREVLDQMPSFRAFLDLLAAYVGSFIIAALIHFIKPQ